MRGPTAAAERHPYAVLAIGVLAVSIAAILIRFAQAEGLDAIGIAAYRLSFAALLLAPFAAHAGLGALGRLNRADRCKIAAAGACLALHFGAWISSLDYTSVASSVALVTCHPLWVALAGLWIYRERPGRKTLIGIALTIGGAALIFAADRRSGTGSNPMLGNMLAVLGAMSVAAYILIARATRAALATWSYVWLVYALAALLLAVAATIGGSFDQVPGVVALAWVLALAVGPQLIGHTAINWSARRIAPTLVSVAILGEPILAAALAWVFLGEEVTAMQCAGFGLTLSGIVLCALDPVGRRLRD